jgi:MFS family permease
LVVSVNNNFINFIFLYILVLDFLISNCNRDFANRNNVSQNAIFTLGILFGIVNGSSRFLWGYLMDKFGFKTLMFAITIMEVTVGISLFFVVNVSFLFVICVLCIGACIGGNFVILAPTFNKIFGLQTGPELYGITSISIGMANLSGPIMTKFILNENKDYLIAFLIGAALSFAKIIILFFFKEEQYEFKNK